MWDLAYPAILTMVSQTVMWTVDAAMVGHVGKTELAAVGLGGLMVWTLYSFFLGLTNSINTFVAQSYGARAFRRCGVYLWQGLYIALISSVILLAIRLLNAQIIDILGPDEPVKELCVLYTGIRMLSAPFFMLHITYSNFFRGIGDTRTPMKVVVVANVLNIVGDYFLIFGKGPFPTLGVAGAAWATALANLVSAAIFTAIAFSRGHRIGYGLLREWRPRIAEIKRLLRIGVPIAAHYMLDMGSFLVFSAYIGRMGTEPLAANQIIIQILALSFMPCQGFSVAATTLMGQYIGAGLPDMAKRSAYKAVRLGVMYAALIAVCYAAFPEALVRIFNSDPLVVWYGKRLILLAAVFQMFDAVQIVASGALRGAGDTKVPAMLAIGGAWLIFIPLAFVLGTVLDGGAVGAWMGATAYVVFLGVAMYLRLKRDAWKTIRLEPETEYGVSVPK